MGLLWFLEGACVVLRCKLEVARPKTLPLSGLLISSFPARGGSGEDSQPSLTPGEEFVPRPPGMLETG